MAPMLVLSFAFFAHAQSSACPGGAGTCLASPLSGTLNSIPAFLSAILKAIAQIGLPVISVYIVYAGFLFVLAQGNKAKLEIAKRNFFYAILGALLILSAYALSTILANTTTQLLGGS